MKKIFCLVCFFLALFSLKSIADVPEGCRPLQMTAFFDTSPLHKMQRASVCQKSLSLRASPRREASALGVQTGVAIRFQNA